MTNNQNPPPSKFTNWYDPSDNEDDDNTPAPGKFTDWYDPSDDEDDNKASSIAVFTPSLPEPKNWTFQAVESCIYPLGGTATAFFGISVYTNFDDGRVIYRVATSNQDGTLHEHDSISVRENLYRIVYMPEERLIEAYSCRLLQAYFRLHVFDQEKLDRVLSENHTRLAPLMAELVCDASFSDEENRRLTKRKRVAFTDSLSRVMEVRKDAYLAVGETKEQTEIRERLEAIKPPAVLFGQTMEEAMTDLRYGMLRKIAREYERAIPEYDQGDPMDLD